MCRAAVERYFEGVGRIHSQVPPYGDDSRTPIMVGIQDEICLKESVANC